MLDVTALDKGAAFDLKYEQVELTRPGVGRRNSAKTLQDLEATRVGRGALPASRNGLEAICGASCDTAAQ